MGIGTLGTARGRLKIGTSLAGPKSGLVTRDGHTHEDAIGALAEGPSCDPVTAFVEMGRGAFGPPRGAPATAIIAVGRAATTGLRGRGARPKRPAASAAGPESASA